MKSQFYKLGLLVLACAMGFPLTAMAQQSPSPQAISLYNLGLTAYKQGSPESAVIFFKRACDIDPNLADAQYNLGIIFQTQHRYRDAIPRFLEVLRIKPADPDAHYQLGIIYQESGRLAEASQQFSNIAPSNPRFADSQNRIKQITTQAASVQTSALPESGQEQVAPVQPAAPINLTAESQPLPTAPQAPYYTQTPQTTTPAYPANPPQVQQPAMPITAAVVVTSSPVAVLANASVKQIANGFSAPAGLAFDHTGNLYVANFLSNTIDRISPDGTKNRFNSGTNIKGPIGLTVDENGNVYVANYNSGSVARINPAGVSTIIATGFKRPYYLTLDKEGNLYVSQQEDNSVVRITLPHPTASKSL